MITTTLTHNGQHLKLKLDCGQIGPQHDPYSANTVYAEQLGSKRAAELYGDGLGTRYIKLFDEHGRNISERRWYDTTNQQDRLMRLKARILFRRHVGIDPEDVEQECNAAYCMMEEDPMGPASLYI